ncbi:M-phase phosphoprotein 8, partial [Orbilia oligospora]
MAEAKGALYTVNSGAAETQLLVESLEAVLDAQPDAIEYHEVNKIVDEKFIVGMEEPLYLIRWKGYCKEYDTWEPAENFKDCKKVLQKWKLKKLAKQKAQPQHEEIVRATSSASGEVPVQKRRPGRPKGSKDKEPRSKKNRKRSRSESDDSEIESIVSKKSNVSLLFCRYLDHICICSYSPTSSIVKSLGFSNIFKILFIIYYL